MDITWKAKNKCIEVDIHNMVELQARKYLEKEIIARHKQGYTIITVIHGYREGTVLQLMVRKGLKSKKIKRRMQDVFNKGQTHLILEGAKI